MKKKMCRAGSTAKALRPLAIVVLMLSLIVFSNMGSEQVEALDPHIVTGTVYEANGTAISGVNVTIVNARTGETSNATSNATGVYAFNLLNLPLGWAFGDTIQVNGTNATGIGGTNSTQILIGLTSTVIDIWIGTTSAISGINFYIIDEDGYPVESALINIKDSSGDIQGTKMSDSDGKASTTLSDGLFIITVAKSGFDDVVQTIRVHGVNTFTIRLGIEVERGVVLTDLWFWVLIIFALIGIVVALSYLAKKV